MKQITFAVPCYNSAPYMRKCIESLLLAGEDAEIIIVDDGSYLDDTAKIADEYADEYPSIVRVIHKENGGHGDAVTCGIKNAIGRYFKVVDSDDYLDEFALYKLMFLLRSFKDENCPETIVTNYVYDHLDEGLERVVSYRREFPKNKVFNFEESKPFAVGKYLSMHSLIYKTQLLKDMNLTLPKHTFYVDNVFILKPLFKAKTFYYLDVNLYKYFIGRVDQSVNESVIIKRIDQHVRVTKVLIDDCDINSIKKTSPKLYRYALNHFAILFTINSIYLIKSNTSEALKKKSEFWEYVKNKDRATYNKVRSKFVGLTASNNKLVCKFCCGAYTVVRKIFKFN